MTTTGKSSADGAPTGSQQVLKVVFGDLKGITAESLPEWCDMSLMPQGDALKAEGTDIHVLWTGLRQGLFYDW